jgi:Cu2+-exporting ATPase
MGQPRLVNAAKIAPDALAIAGRLGGQSRHPLSQAIARSAGEGQEAFAFESVAEIPGSGIEGKAGASVWRLGRAAWALGPDKAAEPGTILAQDGEERARFIFEDGLRPGAARAIRQLQQAGKSVEMLSGDTELACRPVATSLGIAYRAAMLPADKVARIAAIAASGHKALMVGDGLNDAPALSAAHVSMAPASAADIGRNAADLVFLRDSLSAVPFALEISRRAGRLIRQNIGLAVIYNAIAIPIALLGHVTPLIAAIAMSGSSILVTANALRLLAGSGSERHTVSIMASQPQSRPA